MTGHLPVEPLGGKARMLGRAEPKVCSSRLVWVTDHPEGRLQKSTEEKRERFQVCKPVKR